jgi:hypothetical protein
VSLDTANSVSDVLYRLGFQSAGDIAAAGAYVSVAELYQWADEAAKRLAYESGVFLTFDVSITVTSGTAVWTLPAAHVYTVMVWLVAKLLRISTVGELFALDGVWPVTSAPSERASFDASGVGTVTLYPNPTVGGTLGQVCQLFPGTIALGGSTVALPTVLQDYFSYAMLAGARGKESDAAMPEMAGHFEERMALYEKVIQHLYGPGQ